MLNKIKKYIYDIFEPEKPSIKSTIYHIIIGTIVLVSACCVILELFITDEKVINILTQIELYSVGVFVLEYLLKLFVSQYYYPEKNWFTSKIEYLISFDSFIDIICILSIFSNEIPKEFATLRLLKLVKLTRLIKLKKMMDNEEKPTSKLKKRIYDIISKDEDGDILSKIYDILSVVLIGASLIIIILDTFSLPQGLHNTLVVIEYVIAIIFVIEYVLRVWTAEYEYPECTPDKAKMKYIFSFMALVDLLSIVPVFFVNVPTETAILKLFKLFKIARLIKMSRYINGIYTFGVAVKNKSKQIVFSLVVLVALVFMSSILLYAFEHSAQPDVFTHGFSGLIYALTILTGYGESSMQVVTPMGNAMVIVMLISGACVIGVPLGIVSGEFASIVEKQEEQTNEKEDIFERVISELTIEEKEEIVLNYLPKQRARREASEENN